MRQYRVVTQQHAPTSYFRPNRGQKLFTNRGDALERARSQAVRCARFDGIPAVEHYKWGRYGASLDGYLVLVNDTTNTPYLLFSFIVEQVS